MLCVRNLENYQRKFTKKQERFVQESYIKPFNNQNKLKFRFGQGKNRKQNYELRSHF